MIVSKAREASQLAEDARAIAVKRAEDDEVAREREKRHEEREALRQREAQAQQAQADAAAAQQAAEQEQAAADQAVAQAQAARSAAKPRAVIEAQPVPVVPPQPSGAQRQARAELLDRLNRAIVTRDTPRGLVVTVGDDCFESGSANLRRAYTERLALVAAALSSRRDLQISVEGFTDDHGSEAERQAMSERRAQEIRAALVANGLQPAYIRAMGFGGARPTASNATTGGREQNRRVEIVISGPSIGGMALWDRTYPLKAAR